MEIQIADLASVATDPLELRALRPLPHWLPLRSTYPRVNGNIIQE